MKYLLIFFIVTVLVFQWRSSRTASKTKPKVKPGTNAAGSAPSSAPQAMVACSECGLHVPGADAVQGSRGVYCSSAHRQLREP